MSDLPDDIVTGPNPDSRFELVTVPAWHCKDCDYTTLGQGGLFNHLSIAHPASRDPQYTCQDYLNYDGSRWCVRRRNHEGQHWTPSHNERGVWW